MWYSIPENICDNTNIANKSILINQFLNLIEPSHNIKKLNFKEAYINLKEQCSNTTTLDKFYKFILEFGRNPENWIIIEEIKKIIKNNLNNFNNFNNLISYKDLERKDILDENTINIIIEFCEFLWEKFYTKNDKEEFVSTFIKEINPQRKCMCCGINALSDGSYNTVRSDIDHWFPKKIYPFLSFYKKNLFVICSSCNKKKSSKIMEEFIINPHSQFNFKLKLNSFSIIENKFDFKITSNIENYEKYLNVWNKLFNINNILKKEFEIEMENYIEVYKDRTLESLQDYLNKLIGKIKITAIAYVNYKIDNYH